MIPLAHGIGHGVCLENQQAEESLPAGFGFWALSPAGAVSLVVTLLTDDGEAIYVRWGDGEAEWVEHNTPTTHSYAAAGDYELQISTPTRLTSFVNADSTIAFAGTVDTSAFPNLTILKIRKASITAADVSASVLLETIELNGNELEDLDVSANTALTALRIDSNALTASVIDDIITDIYAAGESSGTLNYDSQDGGTEAWDERSQAARNAQVILDEMWTITPATPVATTFWTIAPAAETTVAFTPVSDDSEPLYVYWGDGTHEYLASGEAATHTYGEAGSYAIKFVDPTRLTSIIDTDEAKGHLGVIDTTAFTALETLKIRKSGVTEITIPDDSSITVCEVDGNDLSATEIDDIISNLNTAGESSGTLDYDSQDDGTEAWASRSGAAQTAQYALEAAGWTVTPVAPAASYTALMLRLNDSLVDASGRQSCAAVSGTYHAALSGQKAHQITTSGSYVITGTLGDFALGSGKWTLEWFLGKVDIYAPNWSDNMYVYIKQTSDSKGLKFQWYIQRTSTNVNMFLRVYNNATSALLAESGNIALSPNTATTHVVVQYDGANIYIGINGTRCAETSASIDAITCDDVRLLSTSYSYVGIQEVRFTSGEAIYSGATYTPPSIPLAVV